MNAASAHWRVRTRLTLGLAINLSAAVLLARHALGIG